MNETRICENCPLFDNSFRDDIVKTDANMGRCLLYDAVQLELRNINYALFDRREACRFKVPLEADILTLDAVKLADFLSNEGYRSFNEMVCSDEVNVDEMRKRAKEL